MLPTIDEENQVLFNFEGDVEEGKGFTARTYWIDGIFLAFLVASGATVDVLLLPMRLFLRPKYERELECNHSTLLV